LPEHTIKITKEAMLFKIKAVFKIKIILRHPIWYLFNKSETWLEDLQSDVELDMHCGSPKANRIKLIRRCQGFAGDIRRLARTMEVPDAKLMIQGLDAPKSRLGKSY
jgi:hypothetical protein